VEDDLRTRATDVASRAICESVEEEKVTGLSIDLSLTNDDGDGVARRIGRTKGTEMASHGESQANDLDRTHQP
jgi:hypothetical protein